MSDIISGWKSPYQDERFRHGADMAGLNTDAIDMPDGKRIFFHGDNQLIAWEVSANIDCSDFKASNDYKIFQLQRETDQNNFDSNDLESLNYHTIALSNSDDRFSRRFMRNVKKSTNLSLDFKEAVTDRQISLAIEAFEPYPERRDGIGNNRFSILIKNLAMAGILRCFVLTRPNSSEIMASSCVLLNETQANLRYYTANRESNAGHLMQYRLINHLFDDLSLNVVDQSGIGLGQENDQKLKNISDFKRQIGGHILRFAMPDKTAL